MSDLDHGELRDRLPDYDHGTLDAPTRDLVARALSADADLRGDLDVIRLVRRAADVPAVDASRIVAALPVPGTARPARTSRPLATRWRAAAAILVTALGATAVATRIPSSREDSPPAAIASPDSPGAAAAPSAPRAVAAAPAPAGSRSPTAASLRPGGVARGGSTSSDEGLGLAVLGGDELDPADEAELVSRLGAAAALPEAEGEPVAPPVASGDPGTAELR